MSGFVLTHKTVFDHPMFAKDAQRLGAWLWLVGKACWKPTPFIVSGKSITLQRGQICVSRTQLSDAWGMSQSAVERFLARLETEQMIERETGQGRSIITICNYAIYQDIGNQSGQAAGQATGRASDKQRTAKEQGNKGTSEEEPDGSPSQPAPKHTRKADWPEIPDWVPVEPWNAFVQMRKDKRAPLTARAVKLTLRDLEKWMHTGQDPGAILDKSTQHCWTGIFELKDDRRGTGNFSGQSAVDPRDGFTRSLHDDLYAHHAEGTAEQPDR